MNYRNPRAVAGLAQALVAGATFDDLDDQAEPAERDVQLIREGGDVELFGFGSEEEQDTAMIAQIDDVANREDTGPGDIAVLVPTNAMVKHYAALIRELGLDTQKLESYDGIPNDFVKVGTYQRGKGLEFKRVFVPRLDSDGINEHPYRGEDEATRNERLELIRRQVFVAVTRARDGVWLGWVDEPAALFSVLRELTPVHA